MQKRIEYLDSIKALGIILVVIGHYTSFLNSFIFLFHMPLFFFISGFLFKYEDNKTLLQKKGKRLMTPYITYLLLFYLIPLILIKGFIPEKIIKAIFGGAYLFGSVGVLWFVSCLFATMFLYNQTKSIKHKNLFIIIMLLLAYINQIYPYYLPGNANVALFTVFFFHLGYIYRQKYLNIHPPVYISFIIITTLIIASYTYPLIKLELKTIKYGIPFLSAFLSSLCILSVFNIFKKNPNT